VAASGFSIEWKTILRQGVVRQMRTSLRFSNSSQESGRKKAAPLGEIGGTGLLEVLAV
jgi:hypothetical protein